MGKHARQLRDASLDTINKEWYSNLDIEFYTQLNHPVALLRALYAERLPWICSLIEAHFKRKVKILDLGSKMGLLANSLAERGHIVVGVDPSEKALTIARERDLTKTVRYFRSELTHLPFSNQSFDVVLAMDILEYYLEPERLIQEASRLLCQRGLFIFHTINRTLLSHLLITLALPLFIKNTPKNFHKRALFLKPIEMQSHCLKASLLVKGYQGFVPKVLDLAFFNTLIRRVVSDQFRFVKSDSLLVTYGGWAVKEDMKVMVKRPSFEGEGLFAHDF